MVVYTPENREELAVCYFLFSEAYRFAWKFDQEVNIKTLAWSGGDCRKGASGHKRGPGGSRSLEQQSWRDLSIYCAEPAKFTRRTGNGPLIVD